MSVELYLAYVLACIVITIIPGPTVTLIAANSLAHGTRAGLLNVVGHADRPRPDDAGADRRPVLDHRNHGRVVRLAALYRRGLSDLARLEAAALVGLARELRAGAARRLRDCKASWCCSAIRRRCSGSAPSFRNSSIPTTDYVSQVVLLGVTAMATAAISDGAYAVLAGGARTMLSRSRVRMVSRLGGLCLIGGGAWLALTRVR